MPSVPQTYTISDFIEWERKKALILDPEFQRGSVWTQTAKVFLIDTILNDYPVPQIYFRTKIDAGTQSTVREVVDGQQRLRAILEFAAGKLKLTSKAPNHKGKTYTDLSDDDKEKFLSYRFSVIQLVNASNADVLEVFARLNSYSVKVTPAELRHAEYSEPIKWAVYDAARDWHVLWDEYALVGVRESVRLKNNSLMAEFFMTLDQGLGDGGEASITKYYKSHRSNDEDYFRTLREKIDDLLTEITNNAAEVLKDTPFFDAPNFLILFSALAYHRGMLPPNELTTELPAHIGNIDWALTCEKLIELSQSFDLGDDEDSAYRSFVQASRSSTHRVSSRKVRLLQVAGLME